MKISDECPSCLKGLIERTVSLLPIEEKRKEAILKDALLEFENLLSPQAIPIQISRRVQERIKRESGVDDPYREVKEREMELALEIFKRVRPLYPESLKELISLSALGNALDFFAPEERLRVEMLEGVKYAIDEREELLRRLKPGRRILFVADNAGEVYFDLPLLKALGEEHEVIYAVKGGAVQNDLTLDDLKRSGLYERIGRVISSGVASPGIELELSSPEFREAFHTSDLIIAKGMGSYESLSELKGEGRFFLILRAKCPPVARSLNVPLNSYVAKIL